MIELKDLMRTYTGEDKEKYTIHASSVERSYFHDPADIDATFKVYIININTNMICMEVWYKFYGNSFDTPGITGIADYKVDQEYIDYRLLQDGTALEPQPPKDFEMITELLNNFLEYLAQ